MNILLEIAGKDIIVIALTIVALCIFGVIIFYIVKKDKKEIEEVEEIETNQNEKPVEITEEQQKAKNELERVFNQMSLDLETKSPKPEEIEAFEREQEENAIISYQELIRQASKQNQEPQIEKTQYEEPQNKEKPKQKFKNSEIISPIFGIQNKKNEYKKEKPKHAYEEIKTNYKEENNKEFLSSLKEFRKNL